MWLLKRLAVLWLASGLIIGGLVVITRLSQPETVLSQLGFAMCDGQPCFRGIKVGASWSALRDEYAAHWVATINVIDIPVAVGNLNAVRLTPTEQSLGVRRMVLQRVSGGQPLPIQAGDLLLRFGVPCKIGAIDHENGIPSQMIFIYPDTTTIIAQSVRRYPSRGTIPLIRYFFRPESPVWMFVISLDHEFGTCRDAPFGKWHGFASAETYLRYYIQENSPMGAFPSRSQQ